MTDITAAHRFVTLHARLIDRRRLTGDAALIRAALAAYRNPDGGFAYLEPDLPDLFQDQAKVQQILNNLLSNAIKFTPEGGRIVVSAAQNDRGDLVL